MPAPATPSLLDAALAYAAKGWRVFPLHSMVNGQCSCGADVCSAAKHPRTADGFKSASSELARINGWWRTWPTANIGIATGKASGFWVLDVDPDKGGEATLAMLVAEHEALPATLEAMTGSGGRHLLFAYAGPVPNSTQRLGPGLDVRGDGGYIVAAPSNHKSGGVYEWQEPLPLASAPTWLVGLLRPPAPPMRDPLPAGDNAYKRASAYLAKIPGAVSGERGHDKTWDAAIAIVRGFRLTEAEAEALLLFEYNPRCSPQWSEKEIAHKVRDAMANGRVPFGYLLDADRRPAVGHARAGLRRRRSGAGHQALTPQPAADLCPAS
jgi:hypothetical protein